MPGIFCDGFLLCRRRRIVSISNPYCLPFCFPLSECSASSSLNSTILSSVQSSTAQIFPAYRAERVQIRDTSRINVVNGRQTVAPSVISIFYHNRPGVVNFSKTTPPKRGGKPAPGNGVVVCARSGRRPGLSRRKRRENRGSNREQKRAPNRAPPGIRSGGALFGALAEAIHKHKQGSLKNGP